MNTKTKTPSDAETKLYEIIRKIEIGMLTTVCPDGSLHTRPMVTRYDETPGELWFFTRESASKTGDVDHDRHVSVGYADGENQRYASIAGTATLVHDRQRMSRFWAPSLVVWFPRGPEDPELMLMRVRVRTGEYWDPPSKTMVEIIAAVQDGLDSPPAVDTGEHARIDVH